MSTDHPAPLPEVHLSANAYTIGHWTLDLEDETADEGQPRFDLDAPYQRGSVWTTAQRQALIRSLYMGVPVGAVIVSRLPYAAGRAPWRVVDGKQRVEAVRSWVTGGFEVPSWWFRPGDIDPAAQAPGLTVSFHDLTDRGQRHFSMGASLPALEFDAQRAWLGRGADGQNRWRTRTDDEILLAEAELYLLVNGAGTAHTPADLQAAIRIAEELAR